MHHDLWTRISSHMAIKVEETLAIRKSSHIKKFTNIYNERALYNRNNKMVERHSEENNVLNLSNYNLNKEEISVLKKGLKVESNNNFLVRPTDTCLDENI